jgi:hypothetical protein
VPGKPRATVAIPEPTNPWDRRVDETPPAWFAFVSYRDMGAARSQVRVCREIRKSRPLISRWSAVNEWVARAELWDAEQDRVRQRAILDSHRQAVLGMGDRHANVAQEWLGVMERVVRELLARIVEKDTEAGGAGIGRPFGPSDVALDELLGMIRMVGSVMPRVAEMERLARGIAPSEPVDELKLRATIKAEFELSTRGGGSEETNDPTYVEAVVRALVEAGAIPGLALVASATELEGDDGIGDPGRNGHSA